MADITNKPLAKQAYELCLEIEQLPASEQQTKISTMASALLEALAALEDDGWIECSERLPDDSRDVEVRAKAFISMTDEFIFSPPTHWREPPPTEEGTET